MGAHGTTIVARDRALARIERHLLRAVVRRVRAGTLRLTMDDGSELVASGPARGPSARLDIHRARVLRRLLGGGVVGLLESYVDGDWDSPDLATLLELGARNQAAVGRVAEGLAVSRWLRRLAHARRRNHRRGSRRNVACHYDLGNDFYGLWLDPGMTYSGALFASPEEPLESAQQRKHGRLLELLRLRPEHHLLEIGCGWGGFALHAARQTGCRVTGITLSREQLAAARSRAARAGLAHRVHFELRDYRDLSGTWDRIVSIEMFEAVGERYWPGFFATLRRCLADGGRAVMQVITIDDAVFPAYRRDADFIQRHIFPGGMLPSVRVFRAHAGRAGLATEHTEFHGADYARTLALWARRFAAAAPQVLALGHEQRFQRMWQAYLAYCEAGFRIGRVDLMQTVLLPTRAIAGSASG